MNDHYPIATAPGTAPSRLAPQANVANNTITISKASDTLKILTDVQVVALMHLSLYTTKIKCIKCRS